VDGLEGLQKLKASLFDVVFCDFLMPGKLNWLVHRVANGIWYFIEIVTLTLFVIFVILVILGDIPPYAPISDGWARLRYTVSSLGGRETSLFSTIYHRNVCSCMRRRFG
jgi:hypothetical protein